MKTPYLKLDGPTLSSPDSQLSARFDRQADKVIIHYSDGEIVEFPLGEELQAFYHASQRIQKLAR